MKTTASPALVAYLAAQSENPVDLNIWIADLYTFTLKSGTVLRWTSWSDNLKLGSSTFLALTPAATGVPTLQRSKIHTSTGLSVDDVTVDLAASPLVMLGGTTLLGALRGGAFDGAQALIQRVFMPTPGDTVTLGAITYFAGYVGVIEKIGSVSCTIHINSYVKLLDIQMPRNLFQPGCLNTLFDPGCTLSAAAFISYGVVGAGATVVSIPSNLTQSGAIAGPATGCSISSSAPGGINLTSATYYVMATYVTALGETLPGPETFLSVGANRVITVTSPSSASGVIGWNIYVGLQPGSEQKQNALPIAIGTSWTELGTGLGQGVPPPIISTNGYFAQGVITFTSGANNGLSRVVIAYDSGGLIDILIGLPAAPASGDTFSIVPGCDKQMSTCSGKFNNLINFRGHPFVPVPETVF